MTTKVKPSSQGQLQCQTLESLCWCPGCCSFQRPDFAAWIIRQSHYIWYIIYDIWFIIYSWQETWAINSSLGERLLPAAALAFSSQRRRLEQSSWSWEQHRQNNVCLDVLLKYWHNLEDHVVLPDVRVVCDGNILGHFGDPRNRNCGEVAANLRRSFFIYQLFVIDSQKWQQLQFFSGLTSIKRASLFSLADSSVDLSSKD